MEKTYRIHYQGTIEEKEIPIIVEQDSDSEDEEEQARTDLTPTNTSPLLITCIYKLNSYLISVIFMLILCNYDACYLNFYEFSPLVCHYTKVHIYA